MTEMLKDDFYEAEALGPGTWTKVSFGMKLEVPVTINGASYTAEAVIGDDEAKAKKAKEALSANGWTMQSSWPEKGAKIRVNAKTKDGKYQHFYICKPGGGGGEPVPVSDVEKFLAQQRGEGPADPFAT